MHQLNKASPLKKVRPSYYQRGISLIESLVAMVVVALGILGILGVQMRTLTDTSTTVRRAQAIRLIEDLGERMKTNPNASGNLAAYVSAFSVEPTVGNCTAGCDSAQLAAYDLAVWKRAIKASLPLGQASVFVPPAESSLAAGQGRQLGVVIAWRENERAIADANDLKKYKDAIDTTKVLKADGTFVAGTSAASACPADFTCHLQYIPVIGRCAPYSPGSTTTAYYCPGS